jgi:hypothetical protein
VPRLYSRTFDQRGKAKASINLCSNNTRFSSGVPVSIFNKKKLLASKPATYYCLHFWLPAPFSGMGLGGVIHAEP